MGAENFVNKDAGKRSAQRARVLLAAKLRTPHGEVEARLRDLSRKGALVECWDVPPAGTEVEFVRGTTVVPARVAWAGRNRVGLEFHHMIDEHEVLVQLKRRPAPRAGTVWLRRPGLKAGMTAEERKVVLAWGVAVGLNVPESEG